MHVQPAENPDVFSLTMLEATESPGLPRFPNSRWADDEGNGGSAVVDNIIHNGRLQSAYRSYIYPRLLQSNLTVLTNALSTRILFEGTRATGIEFEYKGDFAKPEPVRGRALSGRDPDTEAAYAVWNR